MKQQQSRCRIDISPGCHNNCTFCGSKEPTAVIDRSDIEESILNHLDYQRKIGIERLDIGGCDPGEYGQIFSLIAYAKDIGFKYVRLYTHGRTLIGKRLVKTFMDAGLDSVEVPIYGPDARIHDYVTNTRGSWKDSTYGLENCKNQGLETFVSSVIARSNKDDLIETYKSLLEYAPASNIKFSPVKFKREAKDLEKFSLPVAEAIPNIRRLVIYGINTDSPVRFRDVPFCAIGYYYNHTRASVKKDMIHPAELCSSCIYEPVCDGILKEDYNSYGIGNLKPFEKIDTSDVL